MIIRNDPVPRKFKNMLINPRFQLKFLGWFMGLFLFITTTLYSTTFLFYYRLKEKALNVGIPNGHIFFKFLGDQKQDLDQLFIGLCVINFFIFIGVTFFVSHRIAGPIFKLKKMLLEDNPDSEDFKLRETDFFQELAPLIKTLKDKSQ
jgi:hypothetical protein